MYPILLTLGSFELRSYGVVIALAILAAYLLARREAARRGMDPRLTEDFAFFAVLFGILGARLYYIAFFDPGMFIQQPLMVLAIWKGGIAIHGALLAGVLTGIWFCRKRGISFWIFCRYPRPGAYPGPSHRPVRLLPERRCVRHPDCRPVGCHFHRPSRPGPPRSATPPHPAVRDGARPASFHVAVGPPKSKNVPRSTLSSLCRGLRRYPVHCRNLSGRSASVCRRRLSCSDLERPGPRRNGGGFRPSPAKGAA